MTSITLLRPEMWHTPSGPVYKQKFKKVATKDKTTELTSAYIRRPINGISLKKDTYGCFMYDDIINTSAPKGVATKYDHNILIQNFSLSRMEKNQIIETFGDHYVYFFGERPPTASISGLLLDTETFEWFQQFDMNYNNLYRGTQNSVRKKPVSLLIDDMQLVGYIDSVQYNQSATQDPYMVSVSIHMIVDKIMHLSNIDTVKTSNNASTNSSVFKEFSQQANAYNTVSNKFKSLQDELVFLSSGSFDVNETQVDKELNKLLQDYRKKLNTDSYYNANPEQYIYREFDGVFKSFDDMVYELETLSAQQDLYEVSVFGGIDPRDVKPALSQIAIADKANNIDSPENVGIYIDGSIADQSLVDLLSDALGTLATTQTPGSILKSKQSSSVISGLAIYGLLNAAKKLTSYMDIAEDALTGVRFAATQTIEGALGGQTVDDVREPSVGEFI